METRTVYLFGRSMLLSLLADSLRQSPNLRVLQAQGWPEVEAHSANESPDVLIYDLLAAGESAILPFLYKNPGLLLIGLDAETNRAVLVTGKERRALSISDLSEVIRGRGD